MVKEYLSQKGVSYEDKDVSVNQFAAQEMINITGQRGVPVTVIDGQVIIGFNRPQLEEALSRYNQNPSFGAAIADAGKIRASGNISGAYVGRVHGGSAAESMGLAARDTIIEINGRRINTASDMERIIATFRQGDRITITFMRGNQTFSREGKM